MQQQWQQWPTLVVHQLNDLALSTMVSVSLPCAACSLKSVFQGLLACASLPCSAILRIFSISSFCICSMYMYCWRVAIEVTIVDTPSISNRIIPPMNAFLKATLRPPLIASTPPVMKPDTTAFQGSSFYL